MVNEVDRIHSREKRHARVRARVSGDGTRPRLCIFRSLAHIYVQAVDDQAGITLAQASTLEKKRLEETAHNGKKDESKGVLSGDKATGQAGEAGKGGDDSKPGALAMRPRLLRPYPADQLRSVLT